MNIGANICKARKAAKISQKELAERLQVYQKDISRWETGERTPTLEVFTRICKELNASADEILGLRKDDSMESFLDLAPHTKLVDKVQANGKRRDGQIVEYYVDVDGMQYLASAKSLWPISQFDAEDYELYEGDQEVGEYIKD